MKTPKTKDLTKVSEWRKYVAHRFNANREEAEKHGINVSDSSYYGKTNLKMIFGYRYGCLWIEKRSYSQMVECAVQADVMKYKKKNLSPFNIAIQMLYTDDDISPQNRSKYVKALEYAYLHNVEPEWLVGFIAQAGGLDLIAGKLASGLREPWYDRKEKTRSAEKDGTESIPDPIDFNSERLKQFMSDAHRLESTPAKKKSSKSESKSERKSKNKRKRQERARRSSMQ